MPSVTRKTRPERRSTVRARLLAAAGTLLERGRSFTEVSVEDLISEAGVARSSFYAHFADKGALLLELAEHVTAELEVVAARWYLLPRGADRDDLRVALHGLLTSYLEHRLTLAAVVEVAAYDERVRAEYDAVMRRRFAEMERGLSIQQREGGVRADVDLARAAPWIGWLIERGLHQLVGLGGSADDHLEGLTTVIWNTFYEGAR
jgi:AcrR family transcriptional regulator